MHKTTNNNSNVKQECKSTQTPCSTTKNLIELEYEENMHNNTRLDTVKSSDITLIWVM